MIPLQLDRAKEKFELLLTQQYQDGHCNHYFFPAEGWEPVTRVHSDNHLWLVMDAYHIALEEGNVSYLDTQAPYFDGGSGTIWEHIKQSIRFTTQNMGAHGFPLMLSSDWNDMLYKVCRKGKGESIWTGMQFAVALRMMRNWPSATANRSLQRNARRSMTASRRFATRLRGMARGSAAASRTRAASLARSPNRRQRSGSTRRAGQSSAASAHRSSRDRP